MARGKLTALSGAMLLSCASPNPQRGTLEHEATPPQVTSHVELFFKGELPFARRGADEWAIEEVTRSEMIFSPDKTRFAYVRERADAARKTNVAHVIIRNIAGDPVNDFAVYHAVPPQKLAWIDNRRVGYLAPPPPITQVTVPDKKSASHVASTYVVHDVNTGEVLTARSGSRFIWDGSGRHVAFLAGVADRQVLVIDGLNIWPRSGQTRILTEPSWSSDSHGIAFLENGAAGPRLVVLVEYSDPNGDLTWALPPAALQSGLKVFWASDSRVVVGEDLLKPKFAAGWDRLQ